MENRKNSNEFNRNDEGLGNGPGVDRIPLPEEPLSPTDKLEDVVSALLEGEPELEDKDES